MSDIDMSNNNETNPNESQNPKSDSEIEMDDLIDIGKESGQGDDVVKMPEFQELEELETEVVLDNDSMVEKLQVDLADAEKRILLAQADLENFRRRTRRDAADQLKYASLGLMNEVLEAVDNLQRAIESYEKDPNGDGLAEGVKLVSGQIATALDNHGCKKIEAVGQPFDPNRHQALQMQPSDEHPANVVMADLRTGYQLHDRIVRPSQVFVSTGKPAE
jgi:molecular chaperone GrpE